MRPIFFIAFIYFLSEEDGDPVLSNRDCRQTLWKLESSFQSKICPFRRAADAYRELLKDWWQSEYVAQYMPQGTYDNLWKLTAISSHQVNGKLPRTSSVEPDNFVGALFMISHLSYPKMRQSWAYRTRVPAIAHVITRNWLFNIEEEPENSEFFGCF